MPEVPEKKDYEPPQPEDTWFKIPIIGTIGLFFDLIIQLISPHVRRVIDHAVGCTFYDFGPIPAGKRARIDIRGNGAPGPPPEHGAVEIFVEPTWPPAAGAPPPTPRVTFGADGETTVYGPGRLIIHKTLTVPGAQPRIRVSLD
jgi:hypothetical protein